MNLTATANAEVDIVSHSGRLAKPRAPRIIYLDGWRGCAILLVLLGHFINGRFTPVASAGVEVFFVLSGRLMADILFNEKEPLIPFIYRRITRVWPVIALFTLSVVVLKAFRFPLIAATPEQLIASASFSYNYLRPVVGVGETIDHMWSLAVEEHCYIILSVVAIISRRWSPLPVGPLLMVASGAMMINGAADWYLGHASDPRDIFWRTDVRGASVLLPVGLFLIGWSRLRLHEVAFVAIMLLGLAAAVGPWLMASTVGTTSLALSVWQIGNSKLARHLLSLPILTWFGRCSFSIYVWQQPIYKYAIEHSGDFESPKKVVFRLSMCVVAVLAGTVSFYLFERPIRHLLNSTKLAGLAR